MPAKRGQQVDGAFFCRLRTASTKVTARGGGTDRPQPVPTVPMPGRKLLMIMNFGEFGADPPANLRLVIGDRGIDWPLPPALPKAGFGMDKFESVEIPIDDSVAVFALIDPNETPDANADLRTIELG